LSPDPCIRLVGKIGEEGLVDGFTTRHSVKQIKAQSVDAPFKSGAARLINYCSHTWSSLVLAMDGPTPFVRCTKASNSQTQVKS